MYILMQVILKKCSNVFGFYVEKTSLYNNLVLWLDNTLYKLDDAVLKIPRGDAKLRISWMMP